MYMPYVLTWGIPTALSDSRSGISSIFLHCEKKKIWIKAEIQTVSSVYKYYVGPIEIGIIIPKSNYKTKL